MRRLRFAPIVPVVVLACALSCDDSLDVNPVPLQSSADAGAESGTLGGNRVPYDGGSPQSVPRVPVVAEAKSTIVDAEGMFFAASEMQIGGEPFAEFAGGRNLAFYDRAFLPTDEYLVPDGTGGTTPIKDLFGFSTAVESYEYSKYHMNSVINFSGAGVSLANGPIVLARGEATPEARLVARVAELETTAGSDVGGYAVLPPPVGNPLNILGFAGLLPVFAPWRSFDPTIPQTTQIVRSCNRATGYSAVPGAGAFVPTYECEYNELHVPDSAVEHALTPATLGFGTWKQALWSIDFGGRLHDSSSNNVNTVDPADAANVGKANNSVLGTDPPGATAGTYIGSNPLEGMWGLVMIDAMDNLASWLLGSLSTADGTTLGGFASVSDAIDYDYGSPLRWFPAKWNAGVDASQPFPPLTSVTIADATSRSIDLAALLVGDAMFFAMTDARNTGIGQRIGLQLLFDGDPFPADDGMPNGEPTAHDRALGVIRVAFVDLVRMHSDPATGVIADTATVTGGTPTRGASVTTTSLAHVLRGLRQTVLSLDAAVTQYGSADEDPSSDAAGILNAIPIHPPSGGAPAFSSHVRDVFVKNAVFVRDVLTKADGTVANGFTFGGAVTSDPTTIDSQSAAIRALTEAFLLTGDESFRERGRACARRLERDFWSPPARMYREIAHGTDVNTMTPSRFGWLQSALRETDKVLFVADDPVLARPVLEDRVARTNKLFMNGWDDLDGDQIVGGNECMGARMQLSEMSLTGELGRDRKGQPAPDRDADCVLNLGLSSKLAVFAGSVLFHSP